MNRQLTIQDIYHGRLDAKDEVIVEGIDSFVESYVIPNNLNLNKISNNSQCFVSGYKGTGKTALLYYLENLFHKNEKQTVSVFIPFKENYSEVKRKTMTSAAQRIVSKLKIDGDAQKDDEDFEYIWSLELFKHIIDANGINKGKLFVSDKCWKDFKQIVKKIEKDTDICRFVIKPSITFEQTTNNTPSITASLEPEEITKGEAYQKFVAYIDDAYNMLKQVERTDVPFYIFIDELEAYYGDSTIFKRDLRLIRDLLIVSKRINLIFWKNRNFNSKIMCAYRTEIMDSINRFTIPKEINKVVEGYDIPLRWNYSNTTSIEHPIMRILLKKIQMAEKTNGAILSEPEIYHKWFPSNYGSENSVSYILNMTWNKPRDIVRLLITAREGLKGSETTFSYAVFQTLMKTYSVKSLEEIREGMRSIYSNELTDDILQCFKGFRVRFTLESLEYHIKKNHNKEDITKNIKNILRDLYRLGMVGDYSGLSDSYHWQHKGDTGPILTDEWELIIHRALWGALQISQRHDTAAKTIPTNWTNNIGKIVDVTVGKILPNHAHVSFLLDDKKCHGIIYKKNVSTEYVNDIYDYFQDGYKTTAKIDGYDKNYGNWILTRNYS